MRPVTSFKSHFLWIFFTAMNVNCFLVVSPGFANNSNDGKVTKYNGESATVARQAAYPSLKNMDHSLSVKVDPEKFRTPMDLKSIEASLSLTGGSNGGGGDEYIGDFATVARQEVYPWLKKVGHRLSVKVDPEKFRAAIDPRRIVVVENVFESCKFEIKNTGKSNQKIEGIPSSTSDRSVEACYDGVSLIYLSSSKYPLKAKNSVEKRRLIAHEIFRKMGLEGDNWKLSTELKDLPLNMMAVCHICGDQEAMAVTHSFCSEDQEVEVDLSFGTEGTLHFGRYSIEVWAIPNEQPRIYLYDSVGHFGASGRFDSQTYDSVVQLLGDGRKFTTANQVSAMAMCKLK
ncbi:MAG: hypothetical protein ACXVB4_17870 [Pseudobdellovibrionaceae bacterium]